jgi:arylamine N-acetyltransferase
MIRAHASRVAAEMIKFKILRYRTKVLFIHSTMSPGLPSPDRNLPMSHGISRTVSPNPTFSRESEIANVIVRFGQNSDDRVVSWKETPGRQNRCSATAFTWTGKPPSSAFRTRQTTSVAENESLRLALRGTRTRVGALGQQRELAAPTLAKFAGDHLPSHDTPTSTLRYARPVGSSGGT